ncbi:MAG: chorismate synthase [Bacteroidetes bacterium CG18_big_fil_WC_8_21_14_2_50_41_14]|nr:MAG: chorismate synthase [Bacteroidetes bacterium CG18_big_fil_WC_8_21_14_2_50_41_14]PIY32889.1 MAG: chorismate synthase [Bacteroidetes bacterium CG_4_10_14_3_um_filter_42_6]PJB59917.1 MAG: chorismate synthase [Bacteroidetes bacterium CG_4_9_14_3_um_filter_41_19]
MAGNIFGNFLQLASFGESHGVAIGGVLDGFPSGITIDFEQITFELNRRRPGQSHWVSSRNEPDAVEFLSGIYKGVSLGTPIAFIIRNTNQHPDDYDHLEDVFRPSHADFTYQKKYGVRDHRGGGRASARETIARVVAGALAKQLLAKAGITFQSYVNRIGTVAIDQPYHELDLSQTEKSPLRCPDPEISSAMEEAIAIAAKTGDTLGGEIICIIQQVPVGLGEPVFNKLHADLARAIMGINAVKGFEIGSGFKAASMTGSQHNDLFVEENEKVHTLTNFSGGIQGGISNGEDIYFKVAFKPVATLMKPQESIDREGNQVIVLGKGRHDVTVVPRAVPIVEAMAALVIADHFLMSRMARF